MSTAEDAANIERNKFNQLARQRYTADDIIDIARFESTRPDNSIAEFRDSGRQIEMLALEYTSDGGHLNELGQERVAAAFLRKVADALRARQSGQS
jgi:lysophospholipase L1-like esterase